MHGEDTHTGKNFPWAKLPADIRDTYFVFLRPIPTRRFLNTPIVSLIGRLLV